MDRVSARKAEERIAELVIAVLRGEGRVIDGLRRPDEIERQRPAPDFDFEMDGERIGLEVVRFTPDTKYEYAAAVVRDLKAIVEERLTPLVVELGIGYVFISFLGSDHLVPTRRVMKEQAPAIVRAIERALRQGRPGERLDLRFGVGRDVDWLQSGHVATIPHRPPELVMAVSPSAHFVESALLQFFDRTVEAKARQTAGYSRSILAVFRGWVANPIDFREHLYGRTVPWWRVYVTNEEGVELVYEKN